MIKKDYGNNYPNYCVLHQFFYKTGAIQGFNITILLFPARFSLIISIFAASEPPQNGTKKKRSTRGHAQRLNIKDLNILWMFG